MRRDHDLLPLADRLGWKINDDQSLGSWFNLTDERDRLAVIALVIQAAEREGWTGLWGEHSDGSGCGPDS